jgi:hypothetical protein
VNQFNGQGAMTQDQQLALLKAQLEAQLEAQSQQNQQDLLALQARGIGFNDIQMVRARFEVLIESLAAAFGPQGQVWAVQARLDWEQHLAQQVTVAQEQGTKAQLAVGGQFTPSMIRQLAEDTGTFKFRG